MAVGGVIKVFAYLLDAATARVVDLNSGATLATVAHDTRIDWLELNPRGTMLLFRDKRHRLHLFDCVRQARATLLPYCNYAQWVPDSDVVVAQRRGTLCVWYSIANPDRVTHYDIRGDVEEIVRGGGKTEVIVDEGAATASYLLDEGLIAFGGAMEAGNFGGAVATLEGLELTPETTGMWQQLGGAALAAGDLEVAERAAVALGDTCRARWLRRTAKVAHRLADAAFLMAAGSGAGGQGGAPHHWRVRVPLQQLQGDFAGAEATLLEQGKPEEAVAMYRSLQEWDEALAVAESHGLPEAEALRAQFTEYLLGSGQEDRAAALKEREGDLPAAAALYLRGGYPAKAAALVAAHPSAFPRELLERVTAALAAAGMYARAGVLMERLGDSGRALESYIRGNAWRQAVELARRTAPARVVELEKGWGDFLMSQRQPEAAVARYIEARAHTDAITAAIAARQFARAAELVADTLGSDPVAARPFWRRLAGAAVARGALDEAERFFLQAHEGRAAVDAYLAAGKPEAAYRVARAVMPEGETEELFTSEASRLEAAGSLRQAEKLLLTVGASDAAVAMYSRAKAWDSVLRLVAAHRPGKLKETRLSVAAACAADGLHRQAEEAYVEAGEWEAAVAMYRTAAMWEDALRVARAGGGAQAAHRVAYAQALSLGPDAGMALLKRLGLIEQAVDFALEMRQWETALELAARHAPEKVLSVHLRHGIALEDAGSFAAAEAEFVAAERPREAIDMYLHLKDWAAALRVAENSDPGSVADVLAAQGQAAAGERDWATAEALLLEAKRPELAVDMYLQARSFPDALRVTKKHLPHRVPEINDRIRRGMAAGEGSGGGGGGVGSPSDSAAASPSAFRDPATRRAAAVAGAYTSSSTALAGGGGSGGLAAQAGRTAAGLRSPLRGAGGMQAAAPSPPGSKGGAGSGDPLSAARAWEAEGEFSLAIDSYMAVGGAADETSRDNAACKAAWLRAVSLANEHDARRQYDVCEEVGHRLADAGEHEEAGALFESLEQLDHAAECFMQAGNWSRARAAARGAPARIREQVEAAYKAAMTRAGDAESSAAAGALEASLKAYAAAGSYDKLFEAAAQAGPGTLATYIYPHVSEHLAAGRLPQAVSSLATYGAPPVSTALPIYKRLVAGVFSTGSAGKPLPDAVLQELRDVLYKVTGALRKQAAAGGGSGGAGAGGASGGELAVCAEFDRLLLPVHYSALRQRLGRADPATGAAPPAALLELCARLAVSALRFAGSLIPADRAFFEAGTACQRVGWKGYAFVLLNRYVDICDAVDDAADDETGRLPAGGVSLARLNNSDFVGTGIPPPAEFLPLAGHWVEARGTRDEIRRWVVEASVVTDAKTSVLPRRPCFSCGDAIFEGSLGCPACKATFPACVVSGFPIPASQLTACSACGSKAIKGAWNAVVTRTKACPWCSAGGVSAAL
jgi:intraflagellar transport protein 172